MRSHCHFTSTTESFGYIPTNEPCRAFGCDLIILSWYKCLPSRQMMVAWCPHCLGLMGDMSTDTTAALGQILNDNEVGQISFSSLSESFNDRRRYPFLMRTALSNAMEEASVSQDIGDCNTRLNSFICCIYFHEL